MADVAATLRQTLAALCEQGPPAGREWCEAWTTTVDDGLAELWRSLELLGRLTVVAVGGYGRRELCPGSDIDVLLLHDGVSHEDLESAVRTVIYPLWDAGLKVGHAVRDRRQAVSIALDDVEVTTALLDARVVAGDPQLLHDARSTVISKLRRRPASFLEALQRADAERRARVGDAAEVLEPDLKRGAGTLRDVQSLRWAAAALLGEAALDPLVSARYIGAPDRSRLARAYETILAARVALHLDAEHPLDQLRLDLQPRVADRLGFDRGGAGGADALLHDVFLAARTIDHIHRRAWTVLRADALRGRRFRRTSEQRVGPFGIVDGVLRVEEPAIHDDPTMPIQLLEVLVAEGAVLDRTTAARLARDVEGAEPYVWTTASRDAFLRVLWRGDVALAPLAEFDDVGLLTHLLPEWAALRGRPQRNPFHRFSLDRHALHAAADLAELVRHEAWATATLGSVEDRDGLMLGVLLHDVGKAHGEPHSETGVPVARGIVERLGYGPRTADFVATLVRHHLLLPDVATRRDLSEPGLVESIAETVGDAQTLAALHLLAAADGTATGPTAWTHWKATLVRQLVQKVRTVLGTSHPDLNAETAERTALEAQELAPELGVPQDVIREHLTLLPVRYAAAVTPRAAIRHAGMAAIPLDATQVRTRVTPGSDGAEYDELDVVARDRAGLFARVVGVLAIHDGSVLGAHAFTRRDGVAVDTFTVSCPRDDRSGWWAAVEGDLAEAAAGRVALRARIDAKGAKRRARSRPAPDVERRVVVYADESGRTTVVEVHAPDQPGLLFRIASAFEELSLDIVFARITTLGPQAVDVFGVRDAVGEPLDDDHVAELTLALEAVVI